MYHAGGSILTINWSLSDGCPAEGKVMVPITSLGGGRLVAHPAALGFGASVMSNNGLLPLLKEPGEPIDECIDRMERKLRVDDAKGNIRVEP